MPDSAMIASAVLVTMFLTNASSFTSPTSGIMISGTTFHSGCAFWTLTAASMIARVCMAPISG